MNIKNRILRLEKQTGAGSEFCQCKDVNKFELYRADLSVDSNDATPHLMNPELAVPDNCPHCRKFIEKQQITIQFCDSSTKDRFPDEWNRSRNQEG